MAKKKNRCRIKSCNVVIKEEYFFCFMHRRCSLHTVEKQPTGSTTPIQSLRRFYCLSGCGQSFRAAHASSCRYCGGTIEEVTEGI
jgi:hypothetical protein